MTLSSRQQQLIASLQQGTKVRVLFVCLGNICRSPAAQGVLEDIAAQNNGHRWIVDSAGTGNYHTGDLPDRRMRIHAQRRGYNLTHRARQVTDADFADFDIIIPMDGSNEANLRRIAPTAEDGAKIVPMSAFFSMATRYDHVPDPYYEGAEGFELVLDLLENACQNLFNAIGR